MSVVIAYGITVPFKPTPLRGAANSTLSCLEKLMPIQIALRNAGRLQNPSRQGAWLSNALLHDENKMVAPWRHKASGLRATGAERHAPCWLFIGLFFLDEATAFQRVIGPCAVDITEFKGGRGACRNQLRAKRPSRKIDKLRSARIRGGNKDHI